MLLSFLEECRFECVFLMICACQLLEGLLMILENIFKNNKEHMKDYRMALQKSRIFVPVSNVSLHPISSILLRHNGTSIPFYFLEQPVAE